MSYTHGTAGSGHPFKILPAFHLPKGLPALFLRAGADKADTAGASAPAAPVPFDFSKTVAPRESFRDSFAAAPKREDNLSNKQKVLIAALAGLTVVAIGAGGVIAVNHAVSAAAYVITLPDVGVAGGLITQPTAPASIAARPAITAAQPN